MPGRPRLTLALLRDLNLVAARRLDALATGVDEVHLDLSCSRLVDSEGLMGLYRLVQAGKRVVLYDPPPLYAETVRLLGLEDLFAPVEVRRGPPPGQAVRGLPHAPATT